METKHSRLIGNLGGAAYVVVGIGSILLGIIQTFSSLSGARQGKVQVEHPYAIPLFITVVAAFAIGMLAYRAIAMRNGFHPAWIWYSILLSGVAMIFAGIVTGRIVLILFGVSNLLHVFGTREVYFPKS